MKLLLLPFIFVSIGQTTLASTSGDFSTYTQGRQHTATLPFDKHSLTEEMISIIREMDDYEVADAASQAISSVNQSMGFARLCRGFATDAELGTWGELIFADLEKYKPRSLLKGAPDLYASCPAYPKLDDAEKSAVWVMIINTMAHLESSCRDSVEAKGPNGTLIGLLQLHKNNEAYYADNSACKDGAYASQANVFRCSIAMLNGQIFEHEALFTKHSYWDVLIPRAKSQKYKKVQTALTKFSLCKKQ